MKLTPRLLRLRDAPNYLGMARSIFERDVRPYLTHIKIGKQGVAFDRLELDAYAQYARENGTPPEEQAEWQNVAQGFANEEMFGTSTNEYEVKLSGKVRVPETSLKRRHILATDLKSAAELGFTESDLAACSKKRPCAMCKSTGTYDR